MKKLQLAILPAVLGLFASMAHAEVKEITFGYQFGWSYTALHYMETQHLIEKNAKAAGIELKANYRNLGSPGVIRDAMLAGQVNYGAVGVPTLITLADKTGGDIKAVANVVSAPLYLNVSKKTPSLCQITGKIALPTIKSSVQAVTLQMAAKKECGSPFALDANTVSMTHPDAMGTLLTDQIEAHFTAPPFNDLELSLGQGKVRKLLDSYGVLGGPTSFLLLIGSEKFRNENPVVSAVVFKSFEDATNWVRDNKTEAAKLYIKEEKAKEKLPEVIRQMSDKTTIWDTTPNRIGAYSTFMKEVGTVKTDMDWKFLSMPNLRTRNGS